MKFTVTGKSNLA